MLNELPKKQKDPSAPTKGRLFWRIQKECWRRMVTPYLMYLFMSLLLLSVQAITPESSTVLEIVLGSLCIAGGALFNAHLLYHTGILHYDNYLTGELHRSYARIGIPSGGDHRVELEYRPWKGFYIGFLVGLPVIVLGALAGPFYDVASLFFGMFAGWAIIPLNWIAPGEGGIGIRAGAASWSMLFAALPFLVSGIAYIVGAYVERGRKQREKERDERVMEAGRKAGKRK